MAKLLLRLSLSLLALTVFGAAFMVLHYGHLATGYVAKTLCSSEFVSELSLKMVKEQDLAVPGQPLLYLVTGQVDQLGRRATARMPLGLHQRTAVFRPGMGCTVAIATNPGQLLADHLPAQPTSATHPAPWPASPDPRLSELVDWAFSEPEQGQRLTRALLIVRDGNIIAERYARGITADTPLIGWSMGKSLLNTLAGMLIQQGKLDLDQAVNAPEWRSNPIDPRQSIKLRHLLQMTSGLQFDEDYDWPWSDAIQVSFGVPDRAQFAADRPLLTKPGRTWHYSTGAIHVLSRFLVEQAGDGAAARTHFIREQLFEPLGMSSALIESDSAANPAFSSFVYASARDWAKLGQLYLADGILNGRRLLPESWLDFTRTAVPGSEQRYGALFWRRVPEPFNDAELNDQLPKDTLHLAGYRGQFVSIIPSHRLIVVRLGLSHRDGSWNHDFFLHQLLSALNS